VKTELGRALRAWLVVRTALATVVLGLAVTIFSAVDGPLIGVTPAILLGTVAITIVSSFAVAGSLVRGTSEPQAAGILMVLDILVVTVAMGVTGGAGSVLSVLYGAVIVASATALGARASFVAGGLSLASYGIVGLGQAFQYLPTPSDQPTNQYLLSPQDLVFSGLSNTTAMLIVTLLSRWLATQLHRAGGALAESEQSRQRLAELYESIVRSLGSGLLTLDSRGVVTSANPAAAELLGADPTSVVGRPVNEFFPELAPPLFQHEGRAETLAVRSRQLEFPAGYSIARLEGADALHEGTLLAFQDLTDFRRLERAARDAERLATLGRIAATLAHEIRNPLSSISGSVELVREGASLDDENRNLLALVVREVERLDELVDAMLDVARPRDPRFDSVDLVTLALDVCTMGSAGLGATVTMMREQEGPCVAVVDADMIRQVLWNLVKNAVQSSGGISGVEVDVGTQDAGGATWLEVRDQGPGISPGDEARIFDAFHTGRTRGVGLGLALVKQLVDAHEGQITVRNRSPRGASFRVELPLRRPSQRARASPEDAADQE
jgi:two-component system sensor histidine kinase PilS (NtrC family)